MWVFCIWVLTLRVYRVLFSGVLFEVLGNIHVVVTVGSYLDRHCSTSCVSYGASCQLHAFFGWSCLEPSVLIL